MTSLGAIMFHQSAWRPRRQDWSFHCTGHPAVKWQWQRMHAWKDGVALELALWWQLHTSASCCCSCDSAVAELVAIRALWGSE